MKRLIIAASALTLVAGAALAGSIGMTIGTNSVVVLPPRPIKGATLWTNGITIAQGQVVKSPSGYYYFCETATAGHTTEPTHMSGVSSNLRFVASSPRRTFILGNESTANMWFNLGSRTAVTNQCIKIEPGEALSLSGYQGVVSAIAEATNSPIAGVDLD